MKLVHWPLTGGLLHLVQRGWAWAGCGPAQFAPRCTINSPPINGQCTNHRIAVWSVALNAHKAFNKSAFISDKGVPTARGE